MKITELLTKRDLSVIGAMFGLSILVGVLRQMGISGPLRAVAFLMVPAGLISLVFIYLAAKEWGGEVARYLTFIGFGIAVFILNMMPHIFWHMRETEEFLGLAGPFWYIFFHGGIALGFVYITYGFYLFYQTGR